MLAQLKLPRRLLASLGGAGGAAVLQVLAFALTSRALGPEAFGVLSVIFATSILFSSLGAMGADLTIVRTVSRGTATFSKAWGHVLSVTALAFPVAWLAAVALGYVSLSAFDLSIPFWLIAAAIAGEMLIGRAVSSGSAVYVAHEMMVHASVLEFVVVALRAIAAVLVFYIWGVTDLSVWLGVISVQAVLTAVAVAVIVSRRFGVPQMGIIRSDLGFGVLLMLNLFMQMAQSNLDKILLGQMVPARDVGIYSAGTRLQLLGNMGNLWVARMYHPGYFKSALESPGALQSYMRACVPVTLLVGLISAAVMAALAFALPLLVGEGFDGVTEVGLVIALVPPFAALQIPAADALTALDRQRLRTQVYFAALVFMVVAIWAGVSALGMIGAAWALVLTAIGTAVALWMLFLKLVPDAP